LNNLTTTSSDKLLETDGMIYLNAKSGNEILSLEKGKCIIEMPTRNKRNEMLLFYGNQANNGIINWETEDNLEETLVDTIPFYLKDTLFNYFEITQLGWINADRFIDSENKTDLLVNVPKGEEKAVYSLVFKNYNSVIPALTNEQGQLQFKGLPSGEEVVLIGIGTRDNQLYYGMMDLTTDTKDISSPVLSPMKKEELESKLQEKFGLIL
jgi:hypothetical protein